MRNLFFTLFIFSAFASVKVSYGDSISEKKEFEVIKAQIIFSLQKHIIKKEGFGVFKEIVEENQDFLNQDSIQELLKEFVNSGEFNQLALDAISAEPIIYYGLPAGLALSLFKTTVFIDTIFGILPIGDEGIIAETLLSTINIGLSIGTTSFFGVMIAEELTDIMIASKLLSKNNRTSRTSVLLRAKNTCRRFWLEVFNQ